MAMAVGRRREMWEHTSTLQAQILNILNEDPVEPEDLIPAFLQKRVAKRRRRSKGHPMTPETISMVRQALRTRNAGMR